MCCFFYNKNCCCSRNRVYFTSNFADLEDSFIIRPITAVSHACSGNGIYASSSSTSVGNQTIIPITASASTPGTTLSVSNNTLNVPTGVYQISFGASGTITNSSASTFAVQLYANGVPLSNETVSSNASSTLPASLSKTIIYNAISPTAFALYNVSGESANIANAFITAQKLS